MSAGVWKRSDAVITFLASGQYIPCRFAARPNYSLIFLDDFRVLLLEEPRPCCPGEGNCTREFQWRSLRTRFMVNLLHMNREMLDKSWVEEDVEAPSALCEAQVLPDLVHGWRLARGKTGDKSAPSTTCHRPAYEISISGPSAGFFTLSRATRWERARHESRAADFRVFALHHESRAHHLPRCTLKRIHARGKVSRRRREEG